MSTRKHLLQSAAVLGLLTANATMSFADTKNHVIDAPMHGTIVNTLFKHRDPTGLSIGRCGPLGVAYQLVRGADRRVLSRKLKGITVEGASVTWKETDCKFNLLNVDIQKQVLTVAVDMVVNRNKKEYVLARTLSKVNADIEQKITNESLLPQSAGGQTAIEFLSTALNKLMNGTFSLRQSIHQNGKLNVISLDSGRILKNPLVDHRVHLDGEFFTGLDHYWLELQEGKDIKSYASLDELRKTLDFTFNLLDQHAKKFRLISNYQTRNSFYQLLRSNRGKIQAELGDFQTAIGSWRHHPIEQFHFLIDLSQLVRSIDAILSAEYGSSEVQFSTLIKLKEIQ